MIVSEHDPGTIADLWLRPREYFIDLAEAYMRLASLCYIQAMPEEALPEVRILLDNLNFYLEDEKMKQEQL